MRPIDTEQLGNEVKPYGSSWGVAIGQIRKRFVGESVRRDVSVLSEKSMDDRRQARPQRICG